MEATQEVKQIMGLFTPAPSFADKDGNVITFFRHGDEAVEEINSMPDEELANDAFITTIANATQGCSVADLQYEALLWAEVERRELPKNMPGFADIKKHYEDNRED